MRVLKALKWMQGSWRVGLGVSAELLSFPGCWLHVIAQLHTDLCQRVHGHEDFDLGGLSIQEGSTCAGAMLTARPTLELHS